MRIKIDEENDALYFRLDESPVIESEEIQPGIILDYDSKGQAVGIEILGVKKRIPAGELKKLQFETV
ncbi:MAG: DUF2283 domain-containing protein [Dehalococcoidales bacterium]|jgi:uncharacterized protein YuzE